MNKAEAKPRHRDPCNEPANDFGSEFADHLHSLPPMQFILIRAVSDELQVSCALGMTIDLTAPVAAVTYTSYALLLRTPRHFPRQHSRSRIYPCTSPLPRKRL